MDALTKRRVIGGALLLVLSGGTWFLSQPRVPAGQPALVTLDAASVAALRDAFNRDADHARIIILQSPT
jgi:hypothetical protein